MEAVFYDGESARRRTVFVRVTASSVDLEEDSEWIASWPVGAVRRRDAPEGVLRLTCEGGPPLARLDVASPETQAAILAHCSRLDDGGGKERTSRIVLWSLAAVVSMVFSVLFLLPLVAERLTPLIPHSVERRLGNAVDNQIKLVFGDKVCGSAPGAAALEKLVGELKKATGRDFAADVAVLNSDVPNAIALPGGRIYLFRALLDRAESIDEIAGVLAHEMGHAAHRDGLRKLIQEGGTSYLLGLLFGDVTGGATVVIFSRILIDSAYSRQVEKAADDFASKTMLALGRSARPMGLLLKRIEGNESKVPAFLSTHPVTDQRLRDMEAQVPSATGRPLLNDEEWQALKEICKAA